MFDADLFTEERGTVRASFRTWRRAANGSLEIVMHVPDEDKHEAIDLFDGGDIEYLLVVKGVPRK